VSRTDKDGPYHPRTGLRLLAGGGPPRRFILDHWTSRERQAARTDCGDAAKEHRATGTVDTVPTTRQHRQGAQWVWW
jgi:hypothetical protein